MPDKVSLAEKKKARDRWLNESGTYERENYHQLYRELVGADETDSNRRVFGPKAFAPPRNYRNILKTTKSMKRAPASTEHGGPQDYEAYDLPRTRRPRNKNKEFG